jgi:hypothetical protein
MQAFEDLAMGGVFETPGEGGVRRGRADAQSVANAGMTATAEALGGALCGQIGEDAQENECEERTFLMRPSTWG